MQGLRTHDAMRHAELTLSTVWNHFMNMGGTIERMEVDAYLHGLIPLPLADRDRVAQAVNELLDDLVMAGTAVCCRAPYNPVATPCCAADQHCGTPRADRVVPEQLLPMLRPRRPPGS